jgi:hypothetical protein
MFDPGQKLELEHAVVSRQEEGMFIRARNPVSGRIQLFLVIDSQAKAYVRNSRQNCWQQLEEADMQLLRAAVSQALQHGLAVLIIDGNWAN